MKKKFSLNALMHNRRLMMIFSVIAAIVIWALVAYGPSNVIRKTMTLDGSVELSAYAQQNNIRVLGDTHFPVEVTLEGPRSVLDSLSRDEDLRAAVDASQILNAGRYTLDILVSKINSKNADFDIVDINPRTVTVECDNWHNSNFQVNINIDQVRVSDPENEQLGAAILDQTYLQNGMIQLEGPKSVVSKVAAIEARVETDKPISEAQVYAARLLALDEDGSPLSAAEMTNCSFIDLNTGMALNTDTINVTVPVYVQKTVQFHYELANVPAAYQNRKDLVTLSASSVTLIGPRETLDGLGDGFGDLGTFDFDLLTPEKAVQTFELNLPSGVRVLEGIDAVTATMPIGGCMSKTLDLPLMTLDDLTVLNTPGDRSITIQLPQVLKGIRLYGSAASLEALTSEDLVATIDAASNTNKGSVRFEVRITAPDYPDVWVYYGETDEQGQEVEKIFEIYASVK